MVATQCDVFNLRNGLKHIYIIPVGGFTNFTSFSSVTVTHEKLAVSL